MKDNVELKVRCDTNDAVRKVKQLTKEFDKFAKKLDELRRLEIEVEVKEKKQKKWFKNLTDFLKNIVKKQRLTK